LWARLKYDAEEPRSTVPPKELQQLADLVGWLLESYGGVDRQVAYSLVDPPVRSDVPIEAAFNYLDIITDDDLESLRRFVDRVTAYRRGDAVAVNPNDPLAP
jgi:hypothetical protein